MPQLSINFFEEKNIIRNISSPMHLHREIEMLRVKTGKVRYRLYSQNDEFVLKTGDIVFINLGVAHETESLVKDTVVEILQFDPNIILSNSYPSFVKYISAFFNIQNKPFSVFEAQHNQLLTECFANISHQFKTENNGFEFNILGNVYLILGNLFQTGSITIKNINKDEISRFDGVFEYIENNYMRRITMEEICAINYISPSYFCRIFKSVTGKSFVQYLNFRRVYEAEKLLSATDKSITEIAYDVGFSSNSYFDRTFKKFYALTPAQYRKLKSDKEE